jgi:hypothetical protein
MNQFSDLWQEIDLYSGVIMSAGTCHFYSQNGHSDQEENNEPKDLQKGDFRDW